MHWYYPLCSKDFTFENIFSTESISPACFYQKRGFGFDYMGEIPKFHHKKALILYSAPPSFYVDDNNGSVYKFILQLSESTINVDDIILINEGMIGYQNTIYLNQHNFKILFFSERDKKVAKLQAETSLPTKGLSKYEANFELIDISRCKEFDITKIQSLNLDSPNIDIEIDIDRKFNYIKGLTYGLVTGLVNSKSDIEIDLQRSIQEITNSFAEFKNRAENQAKQYFEKSYNAHSAIAQFEKKVGLAISKAEEKFITRFPEESIKENHLAEFLFKHFRNRLNSVDAAQDIINTYAINDEVLGTNSMSKLMAYFQSNSTRRFYSLKFATLIEIFNTYQSAFRHKVTANTRDSINEQFKDVLHEMTNFIEASFLKATNNRQVEITGIHYDAVNNVINFDNSFRYAENNLVNEFQVIANTILANPKRNKGDASKESLLDMVAVVGNLFSKTKSQKPTLLYQYMNNEIPSYSLEKVNSVVMKNFVAFAFNPDSLEKLESFLEAKGIECKWMAYSFWCGYNGFANISRNFVQCIFETENHDLQNRLDSHLSTVLYNLKGYPKSLIQAASSIANPDATVDKTGEFYYKVVHNKYNITLGDFQTLPFTGSKEEFVDTIKKKYGIKKTDGKKIIESYQEFINNSILF